MGISQQSIKYPSADTIFALTHTHTHTLWFTSVIEGSAPSISKSVSPVFNTYFERHSFEEKAFSLHWNFWNQRISWRGKARRWAHMNSWSCEVGVSNPLCHGDHL